MQRVQLRDYFIDKPYRFILTQVNKNGNKIIIETLIKYFYSDGCTYHKWFNMQYYNKFYYYVIYGRVNTWYLSIEQKIYLNHFNYPLLASRFIFRD